MEKIKVTLKDGSVREFDKGTTVADVAKALSQKLGKTALVGKINGCTVDLGYTINEDVALEIFSFDSPEGRDALRHSAAHVMAQAVGHLYPDVKFGIGPAIANGFYYDFDLGHTFTPADLERIEREIDAIVKQDIPFERVVLSRQEALDLFREKGEKYKVEIIEGLPEDAVISIYKQGDFLDLCAGPHVPTTGRLKAMKLQNIAGAYWRGDSKQKMLQRIYGTAFEKQAELDAYLTMLEEAEKRDHRKLGRELNLFSMHEEGPGFPFFHPKGMIVRNELESFWRGKHVKAGYSEIKTPIILRQELWQQSGHWDHYRENMYFTKIDEEGYAVKPMNCPGGMLVYKSGHYSYRDLPLRMAELGLVHRHELSGALHGLMRVRSFTQDDAHLYMLPSQIKEEVKGVVQLIDSIYKVFGFEYHVELSTRPEKAMGAIEIWDQATNALRETLEEMGVDFRINEGDGAFYGPKIDFHLRDSIGRTWQCGTVQLDMQMPEKFDLNYIGEDGQKHRPVMVHRTCFGSIERFIGILIEHYAGAFPVWLAPVQVRIMPIAERHAEYAHQLGARLKDMDVRVEVDARNEKIGYKIREGQVEKIPYMLVVGDKEVEDGTVALRKRGEGDKGTVAFDAFAEQVVKEIREKA